MTRARWLAPVGLPRCSSALLTGSSTKDVMGIAIHSCGLEMQSSFMLHGAIGKWAPPNVFEPSTLEPQAFERDLETIAFILITTAISSVPVLGIG